MSGQALGRPENWFWSHCNGSALLHLFHNWGHTTAGKLGQFAQDSSGVKSHKRSHSILYPLPLTERAQTPLKFSFCPRCCETFTTQSVNVRGGLKLLPDLSQHLKANHSFKKKIIFPEQVFWQQDLGGGAGGNFTLQSSSGVRERKNTCPEDKGNTHHSLTFCQLQNCCTPWFQWRCPSVLIATDMKHVSVSR